ncbi:nucleoside hydrolase [Halobellus ruber]|uniref:Nucleoside hydrolase n=1 Tax=Halobellus ruber TaxID=2761102 RepID=A0A7J9SGH9_9EURY|nr:nucleoside hydrolase [Halobellus ruber]MBB6646065.1 nucleoside hydrolase [Halobellus ruber]
MSERPTPADGGARRVIVDTDTAGDDSQALLLAALSDRIDLDGVTICAGNVEFDYQVENAKYTLDLAGVADDVTVYEGARDPLLKDYEYADYVHGEGGMGGSLFPDTGIASGDRFAPDYIVDAARAHPGEITLVCIAPLTNVALALRKEPELNDLLDSVWVMGGNVNCLGNVTPAAEYNFWVDPDAAKMVLNELDVTLLDWGLTIRDTVFDADTLARIEAIDTRYADFYTEISTQVRAYNRESFGEDRTTQPDSAVVAGLIDPELIEASATYHVDVDEREGLTRGYSAVDENGVGDGDPRTEVVESLDGEGFRAMVVRMLADGNPDP